MIFKKASKESIFWTWFNKNSNSYLFLNDIVEQEKERLLNEFIKHLHNYNDSLYFEIGGHPDDDEVELIITAEGIVEHFEAVQILINAAPEVKGWRITAFKPPMGIGFKTELGNYTFDPKATIFIPLNNNENPKAVGFQVCYPEYNSEEKDLFINGTYLMLDVILGEKSSVLDIDYLEVIKTPENISEYPFQHLDSIQEYITDKKK